MIRTKYVSICADLAAELEIERRLEAINDATLEDLGEEVPDWLREPPLWTRISDLSRENARSELRALAAGGQLPEVCPTPDARTAREAAETNTPLAFLLDGYRAGHRALWNAWSELVDERGFEPDVARDLRREASDFLFAYTARLSALVSEEYDNARPAGTEQFRLSVVRSLLDGEEVDTSVLDYPIEGWHVGLVGSAGELHRRLPEIAAELDSRLLLLDVYEDPWWAWLGRTRPFPDAARDTVAALAPPPGERLGVGGEGRGAAGFRESHREATWAFRCSDEKQPRISYRDVALEDLALRDRDAAAAFAEAELAPILGNGRGEQLLETLDAYFAAGQNARAAAKELGVHHQTVAQRLAAVEELTGRSPAARRAELETALRLRRQLDR